MQSLIHKALEHIISIHPLVAQVTYDADFCWNYTSADGTSIEFNGLEDIGLLEDAADEAYSTGSANKVISLLS